MKSVRKRNPLAFDASLLIGFIVFSFLGYTLSSETGSTGALIGLLGLTAICILLVISR